MSFTWDVPVPTSVEPTYSRKRSVRVAPGVSARTHIEPTYAPLDVVVTQFGESFRSVVAAVAFALVSCTANPPEWPPATRARVTPVSPPDVFQPVVLASNPKLVARFWRTVACVLAVDALPAVSVTVTATVYVPAGV